MRGLVNMSVVAVLLLAAGGCPQGESIAEDELGSDDDADAPMDERDPIDPIDPIEDEPDGGLSDEPVEPESPDEPEPTPRTDVPAELVGTWQAGPIDFDVWENYTEGRYAGRNSVPSRESMTFRADGSAKFHRYEQLFPFYEELVDCEGTVVFHDDGTFTFYPVEGRKRFYDSTHSENNKDRPLSAEELLDPKWAGTRAYTFDASSQPPAIRIAVPSSAPYHWYKVE